MRMDPRIVPFSNGVAPEVSTPDPEKLIAGHPEHQTENFYTDPSGQFFAGIWSSTRGKWRVRYSEHELCCLLRGRVRLMDSDSHVHEFGPGEAFVVPAGFEGTWEVLEDCTKVYAIFEPRAPK